MSEQPDSIDVLCEVYRQLTVGPVLTLTMEQREALREVMEESRGVTTYDVVDDVLTALAAAEGDTVSMAEELREHLRREIEGSIKYILQQRNLLESRALIVLPEYRTRMTDLQLCALIHAQLKQGTSFALPDVEIMQFVDIVNQTAAAEPKEKRLFQLGECIRNLRKDTIIKAPEKMFRIELGEELAGFLRTNLADAIRHDAGFNG